MISSPKADGRSSDRVNASSGNSAAAPSRSCSSGRRTLPSGSAATTSSASSRGPGFTAEEEGTNKSVLTPIERIEAECDLRGISPREAASRAFAAAENEGTSGGTEGDSGKKTQWEHNALLQEAVAEAGSRRRERKTDQIKYFSNGGRDEESSSNNLLRQLDRELRSIPDGEKAAYLKAIKRRCPDASPNDPSSRSRQFTMIQYCDNDTRLAAKRIVEYWEERRRTFGDNRYCLPMTLHGVMKDQVSSMIDRPGHIHVGRDVAGRNVLVFELSPSTLEGGVAAKDDNKMKLWYMLECLCDYRSSQTQDAGAVFIMNCQGVSEASFHLLAVINQALLMLEVFPIHLRAIHIIRPSDFTVREVMPLVKLEIGKELRQRLALHQAMNDEENLGSLEEYGLPRALMKDVVERCHSNQKDWVHHRLAQEYANSIALEKESTICAVSTLSDASTNDNAVVRSSCRRRRRKTSPSPRTSSSKNVALALELVDESGNRSGRAGDERMSRAIKAKIQNPAMSFYDALIAGGFVYPVVEKGMKECDMYDDDKVSLRQRKNQISRRLKHLRDAVATKGVAPGVETCELASAHRKKKKKKKR